MRKRILIGAIVAAVIGVAAYVISQPKTGTLGWHKKEYLHAQKEMEGRTFRKKIERFCVRIGLWRPPRQAVVPATLDRRKKELREYEVTLMQLGFLEERKVEVKKPLVDQLNTILDEGCAAIPKERLQFTDVFAAPITSGPSYVTVLAPRQDVPLWERLILRVDANTPPESIAGKRSLRLAEPDKIPVAAGLDGMLREGPDVRRSK